MSRSLLALAALGALLALPACQLPKNGNTRAQFSKNLDRTLDATGVRTLSLKTGPGTLTVIGEENRRTIEIEGVFLSEAESFAEARRIAGEVDFRIQSERTENPVVQVTEPRLGRTGQAYTLDLTVRVPHTVLVAIEDTKGDIEVGALNAGARITNESGSVSVESVRGGVEVTTQGIRTSIVDCSGRIQVKDGLGDLEIRAITGDIDVQDTDGGLVIRHVTGNVVAADNPTGATVHNIEGDVTLVRISFRTSDIEGVGGNLSFPE